jgi:GntP family gluconate:H+ symporter
MSSEFLLTVSYENDSYFWVVSQCGGIDPKDAFKSYTLITFDQGLTVLIVSTLLYILL